MTAPDLELALAALAEAALTRRVMTGLCRDCARAADGLCSRDHREASAEADEYEAAYTRLTTAAGLADAARAN